jgi:sugar lactone lactonase YvrE
LDGAALAARFYGPRGIAVDSSGTVLVADSGNSLIRRLASGQVSTLAGAFGVGYADGDARVARFNKPVGIVAHSSGHYVIDSNNQVIRNVARSGLVTTLAGRPGVLGGSDGAAAVATFNYPFMGTLEANGNLLVADTYNYRLRRVTPTGNVTTIGTLGWISSSLDGSEATARFDGPIALATAPDGTVYVSERGTSHRLRRLATGNVTTLAGRLQYLDGTGLNARFNTPYSVAVDLSGNVYMADRNNHRIRKMSAAGEVTTVAGTGVPGFADGPAGTAMFKFPTGIDVDTSGNLYVADSENNRIRVVSTSGVVSTLAGSTLGSLDGAGSTARFYSPWGVAVDGSGSVVVADRSNHRIRRVSPAGVVSTVAGASAGYVDGLAASARFNDPRGVAVDSAGNVYVADNGNRRVRRISPTGDVTTIAGSSLTIDINGPADTSGFTGFPGGIRVDSQGAVYVVAGWSLRRIASGMVTSFAGSVSSDGTVDGAGASARFYSPSGLALDAGGNLFMTDGGAIRRVSASGQVTTVAGAAAVGSQDGPATDARFYNPAGLACDESGNVYVADSSNNRIRKVAPDGTTSTLAGSSSGFVDGAGSAARFNGPMGVTYDGAGSLYVADLNNHAIRRVVIASGAVTTVAGASGGYVDGVGSVARFNGPYAVAMAGPGTLVVTDTGNNRLRTITSAAPGQLGVQWGPSFDATGAPLQRFVATATATGRPSASCTVTDGSRSAAS